MSDEARSPDALAKMSRERLLDEVNRLAEENRRLRSDRPREQLQEAIEVIPDGFVLFDQDDRLVTCNQKYRDIYAGHADILVPGEKFEDMLRIGVERGDFAEALGREEEWIRERVEKHQNPTDDIIEQYLSDGRVLLISERRTKEGGIVGIRHDITERKRAEKALRASKERLRDIAESASDWFWEMGPDLRLTDVTDVFLNVTGFAREDIVGKSRLEMKRDTEPQEKWEQHIADLENHRPFRDFQYEILCSDGTPMHVSLNGKPVFDLDGQFAGYRGSGTNITVQVTAEREAAKAQERLQSAIETIDDGFVLYDADDRLVMCNSTYREFYKESADLFVPGMPFETIIRTGALRGQYAEAEGRVEEWVAERLAVHRNADVTVEQQLSDGRWLRIAERRMPDGGTVGLRVDVTQIKQVQEEMRSAKEEAEQANRSKSEFLANMSHELRTPLNAIIGFSEIIKNEVFGPLGTESYKSYAGDIHHSGLHLLDLINDVLNVAAIEAGAMELNEDNIALSDIIGASVTLVKLQAETGGLQIETTIDPDLPPLFADGLRVKQVLVNLLSNAVKFSRKGGAVSVAASRNDDGSVAITVSDGGVGMDSAEISLAMSKFGQVDRGLSSEHEGTGLGLPLTKGLMDLHGGSLEIESEKGKGTVVRVTFPKERVVTL